MTASLRSALLLSGASIVVPLAGPAAAQDNAAAYLERGAKGDLTKPGGARRIAGDVTAALQAAINDGDVKNVILFIGDGMGDSEITVARNYAEGAGGFFKGIDALPITGQYTHYALDRETGRPSYVTNSAASGTAWSTGREDLQQRHRRRHQGGAAQDPGRARQGCRPRHRQCHHRRMQDATPAVQVAHVSLRSCYGPEVTSQKCPKDALENGGLGSISEQTLDTRPDVSLGGGAQSFGETAKAGDWKGKTLLDQAKARGFHVVTDLDELNAVTAAGDGAPLLGLFAAGNMPVRWQGPKATLHGNLDQPPVTCAPNAERAGSVPTLADMTKKAIDLLKGNEKGFFLQVEGASIDKQDHAANPCGQIGETVDLDEAVQIGMDFAKGDGKTLVIVTADHAHASQIVENDAKAPGLSQALNTKDGAVMSVTYGNSETESQGHTGAQLRVAAFGPHAGNFAGLTDQTDMFFTIRDALKLAD